MTTIATDGKTIAGDGQSQTAWGQRISTTVRKIQVHGNAVYAVAGAQGMAGPLIGWHQRGADPKDLPECGHESGWMMYVITSDGCMYYDHKVPHPVPQTYPAAAGTGTDYALGAMFVGATPQQAVAAACKYDTHTGGEIQVVNIAEALGIVKSNGASVHEDRRLPSANQAWLNY